MCGWATVALHHLYRAREAAGPEDRVTIDRYAAADREADAGGDWYDAFIQPDGATAP